MYFFSFRSQSCREKLTPQATTDRVERLHTQVTLKNPITLLLTTNETESRPISLCLSLSLSFSLFLSSSLSLSQFDPVWMISNLLDLQSPLILHPYEKKIIIIKEKKREDIHILPDVTSLMIFFKLIACCLFIYIYTYISIYNVINIRYEHMFGFFALLRLH